MVFRRKVEFEHVKPKRWWYKPGCWVHFYEDGELVDSKLYYKQQERLDAAYDWIYG